MSRRSRGSKSLTSLAYGRRASVMDASNRASREEVTVLPEMPLFFPDPVALDAEDPYLKGLRDELLQREYEASVKATLYKLQELLAQQDGKQKQWQSKSNDRSFGLFQEFDSAQKAFNDDEGDRAKLDPSACCFSPSVVTLPPTIKGVTADTPSVTTPAEGSEQMKITKKEGAVEKDAGESLVLGHDGGVSMPFVFTSASVEKNETNQKRYYSRELPVYMTEPFPAALLPLAEEVGMKNLKIETRDTLKAIAEAQKQIGIGTTTPLQPPKPEEPSGMPTQLAGNTATPALVPSPRSASTFPLADVLVLEAEQRVAAEMFCESICEDIVNLAAEMCVTRAFDAIATAYTAFSVWDEVHDSVIRSFIPQNPHELFPHQARCVSVPPIRKTKQKQEATAIVDIVSLDTEGPADTTGLAKSESGELLYLGLLPEWSLAPSLLDANAILSFHHLEKAAPRLFADDGLRKPHAMSEQQQQHDLTFSCLLDAYLKGGENQLATSGVTEARLQPFRASPAMKTKHETMHEDGDGPGTPPKPIPLDDYARYVLPKFAELKQQDSAEANNKEGDQKETNETSMRRKSKRHRTNNKSGTVGGAPGALTGNEGGEGGQQVAGHGSTSVFMGNDNEAERHGPQGKGKGRRHQTKSVGDFQASLVTNPPTRAGASSQTVEDDLTKALRQLPHGYLATPKAANTGGVNVRNTATDSFVFIEGDRAMTFSLNVKKKKLQKKAADNVKAPRLSRTNSHIQDSGTPPLHGGIWTDDSTGSLCVNIGKGGRTSLNFLPITAPAAGGEAGGDTQPLQQSPTKESQSPNRVGRYVILSRKQQKALEERRRRQKEAAEKAAYEGMFVTILPSSSGENSGAAAKADADDTNGGSSREGRQLNIAPEPGVVVERWPDPQTEKDAKKNTAKKGVSRGHGNKVSHIQKNMGDMGVVVADGGEWIVPEGKYRRSSFDRAAEETNVALAVARSNAVSSPKAASSQPINTGHRQQEGRKRRQRERDVGDKTQIKGPPLMTKPAAEASAKAIPRPARRAPAVVSYLQNAAKVEQVKQRTEAAAPEVVEDSARKPAALEQPRGAKNARRGLKLPRLPEQPPHGEPTTHNAGSPLKVPLASELDKIRRLASILKRERR